MPKKLTEIHASIKSNDVNNLIKVFHSLHGIFSTFGMHKAIRILNSLSTEIKQKGVTENVKEQIDKLELIVFDAMENLKVELINLKNCLHELVNLV